MSNIEALLQPHSIEAACIANRANGKSFILIDVGRDSRGHSVLSLERLKRKVEKCLVTDKKQVFLTTKLYIVGEWNAADLGGGQTDRQKTLACAQEWQDGVETICKLIAAMGNLKELIWTSKLPFMASVFNELPTKLTKLVLDLGNPIRIVDNRATLSKLHIRADDMKPLLKQTYLQELRLLRLRDSLQFVAWKTVFLNKAKGGMRILELEMDAVPIVRRDYWHRANDVHGLTVAHAGLLEKEYKGLEGKGGLHWNLGFGEYLDNFCIRKARIASGLEEAKPLPLHCLKLDGFVIDHLPFEHELTDIVLLACGEKCIDAGLRAPKTRVEPHNWSKKINNALSHCLIQWPNWTGIFDLEGEQRDIYGRVVSQELGLSTPYAGYVPTQLPLTEKALIMKDVGDALIDVSKADYFTILPTLQTMSVPDTPFGAVSNLSERGSDVPTPAATPTATTIEIPAVDGLLTSKSDSPTDSSILHTNGASDSTPPSSTVSLTSTDCNSSFESDSPLRGHKARNSLSLNWFIGPS